MNRAILLVGHGGAPTDFPKDKLQRLKRLEAERTSRGGGAMGAEEAELDALVRGWPRTPKTEPYKFGLEALAESLARRVPDAAVATAYNEFCGPSLEDAVDALVRGGAREIRVVTTMFTRGGIHSECEIPWAVTQLRKRHPGVRLSYAWPFDLDRTADFLARHALDEAAA